jgi:hypothetical protein
VGSVFLMNKSSEVDLNHLPLPFDLDIDSFMAAPTATKEPLCEQDY